VDDKEAEDRSESGDLNPSRGDESIGHAPLNGVEPSFHLPEPLVDLSKALVDLREPQIYLRKPFVDPVEPVIHLLVQIVEALIGPLVSHGNHGSSLATEMQRIVRAG
jgi:hypothetical protein